MSDGKQDGFALIDSLVALAIVALVVPWLVWSMEGGSRRLAADRTRIAQLQLLDRKLAEAVTGIDPPSRHSAGREGDLDWVVEARPLTTADVPGVDLARIVPVEIDVTVEDGSRLTAQRRVSMRTLHVFAER